MVDYNGASIIRVVDDKTKRVVGAVLCRNGRELCRVNKQGLMDLYWFLKKNSMVLNNATLSVDGKITGIYHGSVATKLLSELLVSSKPVFSPTAPVLPDRPCVKVNDTTSKSFPLRFGDADLVYGPKAEGKLRALQKRAGGNLLEDVHDPYGDGFTSWLDRSIYVIEKFTRRGSVVHFDLTHMVDMDNVLKGKGKYAAKITTGELLYIKKNWHRFSGSVKFYKNNVEVKAPWLN